MEVVFPSPEAEGELAFGEFIMDPSNLNLMRTNYADPRATDEDLKALGLSLLVSASCGVHHGQFRRDWHVRFPWSIHPGRKLDPVFRTCTCTVSRELGFHARAINNYSRVLDFWIIRDVGISTTLTPIEYQGLFSRIFRDQSSNEMHMFSFGDLTSAACLCRYTWNSRVIEKMGDTLRKKLIELDDNLAASDLQCIGMSYKPIVEDGCKLPHFKESPHLINFVSASDEANNSDIAKFARGHIFLGVLISGYVPKEDMQELIDDLENSGIRFVYFSPYSESITKAFGDRLGLETDWNSCIILSKGTNAALPDFTDPKSKLPRGVYNIRPHLADVDDIPLNISLFAECDPQSVVEMNSIYAENARVVISVGSTLNWRNSEVFASTKTSIGMEPQNLREPTQFGKMSSMHLSAALTSLTCPIVIPFDCSPYVLTEIIREARCLARGTTSAHLYALCMAQSLAIGLLMGRISIASIGSMMIIVLATVIEFMFAPYEPNILRLMPKQAWDPEYQQSVRNIYGIRSFMNGAILACASRLISQPFVPAALSVAVMSMSATCLHVHLPLIQFGLCQHAYWSYLMLLSLLSICIVTLFVQEIQGLAMALVQVAILVLLALGSNETVKYFWHVETERSEKRAKLQFNTKLGMHSPV
ncbi:hypothetical protein PSACC_02823 [Paramicrosporidium saccamoebae]|uniref:Uncharacterized protein n=1 Tax=Paramicrosporidium saccamoebae TaxID=1246581 RepID=A0A2H9THT6_9FUNG|nr:hypothetical protein PSACC_02823 [Paramicrosporidium saccamoebae]